MLKGVFYVKISTVIERTSLTDRAIRLYIDNGLVAPSIEESYSGRKNIEFSEEDVERLIKISLLRKVGFSITDIKELIAGGEYAKSVLVRFLDQTESNLEFQSNMVARLKLIPLNTDISIDTVCSFLIDIDNNYTLPKEDLEVSKKEKTLKKLTTIFGSVIISVSVLLFIFYVFFKPILFLKYFTFDKEYFSLCILLNSGWLVLIVISIFLIYLNVSKKMMFKSYKLREILSGFLMFITVLILIFSSLISFFSIFISYKSETSDINNYLSFDIDVSSSFCEKIYEVFPKEVPESALKVSADAVSDSIPLTTQYYYCFINFLDPHLNIVAEWTLPDEEFEAEKIRLCGKEVYSKQKGEWTCLFFTEDLERERWEDETFEILMFAYNDKANKVRYIAADIVDSYKEGPSYLSLDW